MGKDYYFDKLNKESSDGAVAGNTRENSVESMLAEAARISREEQGLDVEYTGSISILKEIYFETSDFYACTALIPKGNGVLSLVLVYPLEGLKAQIFHQRVLFGGIVLAAVSGAGRVFLVFYRENAAAFGGEPKETNTVYCFRIS